MKKREHINSTMSWYYECYNVCYETINSDVEAGWSSLMTRPLGSLRAFDMFIQTRKLTSWLGAG